MPSAAPTRRSVLRGLAGLGIGVLATGCTKAPAADLPSPRREADRDRDVDLVVVSRALAASQDLARRYAATVAAFPELTAALAPLEIEHAAHIAALDTTPPPAAPPAPSRAASASSGTASPASSPVTPGEASAVLAAAERASAGARVADLLTCSPAVARLLASIAASQVTHAAVLAPT